MARLIRALLLCLAFAWALPGSAQQPSSAPDAASSKGERFATPYADETTAERAQTQPGNNAPFWREIRESGHAPGYTTLPSNEGGTLIQPFVQYPGAPFTTAGEAWRQV